MSRIAGESQSQLSLRLVKPREAERVERGALRFPRPSSPTPTSDKRNSVQHVPPQSQDSAATRAVHAVGRVRSLHERSWWASCRPSSLQRTQSTSTPNQCFKRGQTPFETPSAALLAKRLREKQRGRSARQPISRPYVTNEVPRVGHWDDFQALTPLNL